MDDSKALTVDDFKEIKVAFQVGKIYPVRSVYVSSANAEKYIFKICTGRKIRRRKEKFFNCVCFDYINDNSECRLKSLDESGWEAVSIFNGIECCDEARADRLATYEELEDRKTYWLNKNYKNEWDKQDCQNGAAFLDMFIREHRNDYDPLYRIEIPTPSVEKADTWTNAVKFEPGQVYKSYILPNAYEVIGHRGKSSPLVYFMRIGDNREYHKNLSTKFQEYNGLGWSKCEIIEGVEICRSMGLRADDKVDLNKIKTTELRKAASRELNEVSRSLQNANHLSPNNDENNQNPKTETLEHRPVRAPKVIKINFDDPGVPTVSPKKVIKKLPPKSNRAILIEEKKEGWFFRFLSSLFGPSRSSYSKRTK